MALPIGMLAQGSSWQTATLINQGGTGSGTLDKQTTEAYFKIVVPEEGRALITMTLSGDLSMNWVDMCWYRASDASYQSRKSTGWYPENGATIDLTDAGAGTYYLRAQRRGGSGTVTLKYQFTSCSHANDAEPNDDLGSGTTLESGKTVEGRIGYKNEKDYTDDNDCYKIVVTEDGRVDLTYAFDQTYELNMNWVEMYWYRASDGTYQGRKSTGWYPKANGTLSITDVSKGTYYFKMQRRGGHGGYKLKYVFTPNNYTNDIEDNDEEGKGTEIPMGETVQGHLGYIDGKNYRDDNDCYKITVPQDGRVQLIVNCDQTYELSLNWVNIKWYRQSDGTYQDREGSGWYPNPSDTVAITNASKGTYYIHMQRNGGHGGYTLKYIFTPNNYTNDIEDNDEEGKGTEIAMGETVQGHLGYVDGKNYRDDNDCYKITVPQDGRVQLIFNCEQTYNLSLNWVDVKWYRQSDGTYQGRGSTGWYPNPNDTITITDAAKGTYYVHMQRNGGHGGYTMKYIFTPNRYGNDIEDNDEDGKGTEIAMGQTIQGHIGYLDANDYRDINDCYKIEVPKDGRVQLIFNCEQTYDLSLNWVDINWYRQSDGTYHTREGSGWYPNPNDTVTIDDAGKGTYYVHMQRRGGHGGYTMKYIFTPNSYVNDTEPNDEREQATDVLENESTFTGHMGYKDGNDKRDDNDWIKLDTNNSAAMLALNVEVDTTSTLTFNWVEIVRVKGDEVKSVASTGWYPKTPITLSASEIDEDATYYVHLQRNSGHGGYSLTYGSLERAADSKIRISFVGRDKVRLGVPTEYTVKLENIDSRPSTKFFLLVHATDDIKLLGCKLPSVNGVEELPMDSISYDGDPAMVFVVPSMAPYETYSFNIMAEGLVIKDAREFIMDTSNARPQTHRFVISGTTCLIVAGLVALDYAGDKVTEFMTDVIHDHIDLDEKELAYYRERVNNKVDWGLVEEKTKTGETVVVARRAVKTVATKWLETIPGGGLINFAGELLETTKAFSGAIVRRWLWFTTKDTDPNYKEWERKYNEKLLDAKQGINGVVRSFDPNEMVGPVGYGDENYISATKTMDYQILFENKKEATAPAYRIRISDELDENVFDLNTVRFGSTSHDGVEYNWKMNREGNKLTWDIEGIELPPNVNAPEGEGYVTFSVDLKPGLKNGTQIKNKASIRFDYNEVIETNEYVNTLDLAAPTTKMKNVAKQNDGKFLVTCEGSDSESGISHYQFYISKDGEGYAFLGNSNEPSLSFEMDQANANYSIIAYAVDNVGNSQKSAPDALIFNPTGIRTVNAIADDQWTINRLNGTSVAKGKGAPNLDLPAGVYIIRQGNNVRKVIIK